VKLASVGAQYNEAIKAVAEKAGILATTVRKFIAARAGEDFADKHEKVKQLALVFDEIGED